MNHSSLLEQLMPVIAAIETADSGLIFLTIGFLRFISLEYNIISWGDDSRDFPTRDTLVFVSH